MSTSFADALLSPRAVALVGARGLHLGIRYASALVSSGMRSGRRREAVGSGEVVRCPVCFDEVEPKALVCPRCRSETLYFRSRSRMSLWLRLALLVAAFVLAAFLLINAIASRAP